MLGEYLISYHAIAEEMLDSYIQEAKADGKRLGEFLLGKGIISREMLYRCLADQYDAPIVRIKAEDVDARVFAKFDRGEMLRLHAIPYMESVSGHVLVVATSDPASLYFSLELFDARVVLMTVFYEDDFFEIYEYLTG